MASILVRSLIKFYDATAIETAWETVFNAHVAQLETDVVITSQNTVAGGASGQIIVTPAMREHFMAACEAALAELNGNKSGPAGHFLSFSGRRIEA